MIEIANNPGILQKEISVNQSISEKYLDQIINALKVAGLIRRGATRNVGYKLIRPAKEITIYDIYKAFEFELNISKCEFQGIQCPFDKNCKSQNYWCFLNDVIKKEMQSKTLHKIIENFGSNKEKES